MYTMQDAVDEGYAQMPAFRWGYEAGFALARFETFEDQLMQQAYDRGYLVGMNEQQLFARINEGIGDAAGVACVLKF
ncbi:MAG: hypothetical protein USCAAHI_00093 [Beijerinckiaceae bacterium]|nr:MAG: hypothetical protein USCAAHI_00093 [Beijerinckiaceae bacterium]